jgi:hypothetical protein
MIFADTAICSGTNRKRAGFIRHARKPQAFKPGDEWHPGTEPALAGGVEENQA